MQRKQKITKQLEWAEVVEIITIPMSQPDGTGGQVCHRAMLVVSLSGVLLCRHQRVCGGQGCM